VLNINAPVILTTNF